MLKAVAKPVHNLPNRLRSKMTPVLSYFLPMVSMEMATNCVMLWVTDLFRLPVLFLPETCIPVIPTRSLVRKQEAVLLLLPCYAAICAWVWALPMDGIRSAVSFA